MMRVLFWKEFREHRSIWLALTGVSALALIALVQLIDPAGIIPPHSDKAEIIPGVAVMMAFIYGLTCGAMMLAGEREGGTQGFLDALTGRRTRLWWWKLLIGLVMTLALGLFLGLLVFVLELAAAVKTAGSSWLNDLVWLAIVPGVALLTYAWGMLGSALGRSVLTAVLWALGTYVVLTLLGSFIVFFVWATVMTWIKRPHSDIPDILGISSMAGIALVGLVSSGLLYCRSDLDRRRNRQDVAPGWTGIMSLASWRSLFWLTWRQGWRIALTLAMVALVLGLAVPIDEVAFEVWSVFTLAAGVTCGTCVFAGEQVGSSYRFLGNQRLPPGRVWLVKTGFWLAVGLATALVGFVAFGVHLSLAGREVQKSWGHMEDDFRQLWDLIGRTRFGILWLITGFGVAQFFALLWRKSIVALVVSLPVAAALAGIWIPSLVGGGLHAWQIFSVPIILLVATRLSIWAWMADQLSSFRSRGVLAGAGLLALICLVGGLNYRQTEIPNTGEPFDVQAFVRSIPVTPADNEAALAIKDTMEELQIRQKEATAKLGPPKPPPKKPMPPAKMEQAKPDEAIAAGQIAGGGTEEPETAPESYFDIVHRVLDQGQPIDEDPQLGQWLNEVFRPDEFRGDWLQQLRNAVQRPLGVFMDPRTGTGDNHFEIAHSCGLAGSILAARALQLQARGDDAGALDHLLTALALSRHVRNKTRWYGYLIGIDIEKRAVDVLARWLAQLGPRPELMRRAIQELTRHEAATPPYIDSLKTDYLLTRNSLNNFGYRYDSVVSSPKRGLEKPMLYELLRLAWQAPWEKERLERIDNVVFAGWLRGAEADYSQLLQNDFDSKQRPQSHAWNLLKNWFPPQAGPAVSMTREKLADLMEQSILPPFLFRGSYVGSYLYCRQTYLEGLRLQLALTLYQLEEKKPAPNLQVLVPRYLPELPLDPFSGQSFRYRISAGESIFNYVGFPEEQIKVPAGQGILWSVGPDGHDNGGRNQGSCDRITDPATWERDGLDLIFLVPQWATDSPKR